MSIKLITGDLFTTKTDIIVHGVNCKGVMGSGVAKQIKERFPSAYADYMHKYKNDGWNLGDTQYSRTECDQPRFIVNCATQYNYGKDNEQYVNYEALSYSLANVIRFAAREKYSIAMPKIGAGLGGGNWNIILNIIYKLSLAYSNVNIEIYSLSDEGVKE